MSQALTTAGNASMALVPQNLTEAMKLAEWMSKAKTLPAAVQNPADAFMIVNQAMRWGMDPFAVAQEVSVIQGKLMYGGKIVAAAIHTSGVLDGRLSYDFTGKNGDLAVTVTGKLRGENGPRTVVVRLQDAKTNNQHWAKSPEQMLTYHGARVWARRHAPEVMLGVYAPEEFEPDERPEPRHVQSTVVRPEPPARPPLTEVLNDQIPDFDAPPPPPPKRKTMTPASWVEDQEKAFAELTDQDGYNAIMGQAGITPAVEKLRSDHPDLWQRFETARSTALDRIAAAHGEAEAT